jgi:hypothetical protein
MIEMLSALVGKIIIFGGGSVAIAYGFFIFLGKKWIENKFATQLEEYKTNQNKELEDFRYKIRTLFNRIVKIHEKEYEVLPEAWVKLHDARDSVSFLVKPWQSYPNFNRLKESNIRELLKTKYKWSDKQITELIDAENKDIFFNKVIFNQSCDDTQKKIIDFHRYIVRNSIFMSKELKEQFSKADDLMWTSFVNKKVGEEYGNFEKIQKSYKELEENVNSILDTIENLVQKRLRYDEAL